MLGYKAGLRALELLKPENEHELICVVRCPLRTPYTCSVDGIQASTGCTLGKMSIRVENSETVEFTFFNKRKKSSLSLRLRESAREKIKSILSSEGMSSANSYVERAELSEIFEESLD